LFDPDRAVREICEIGWPERIGRGHRRADQARRTIHFGHRQDVHGPRINWHHNHLRLREIRDALHCLRRQAQMPQVNGLPAGGCGLELPEASRAGPRQHGVGLEERTKRGPVGWHFGHPHSAARLFRQAGQFLRRGLPSARQRSRTAEDGAFVGRRRDLRGGVSGGAIAKVEHDRLAEAIRAAAQHDPNRGLRLRDPERADRIPRPLQRGEGSVLRAGVCVVARGSNVEFRCR